VCACTAQTIDNMTLTFEGRFYSTKAIWRFCFNNSW